MTILNSFIPFNNYDFRASRWEVNSTCYSELDRSQSERSKNAIHCFSIYHNRISR